MQLEQCVGCGAELQAEVGPIHRYMLSSPACWAAFGRIMAAEYSTPELMAVHRLSVDAFAVQHPGDGSRRAIQSVGLHLARLHFQLEYDPEPGQANAFMLRVAAHKQHLPQLTPPSRFQMTTADVAPFAGTERHAAAVREWAQSAWQSWRHAHDFIRAWAKEVGT